MEWQYGEAKISLQEQTKKFVVFYGGEDSGKPYDSWQQATTAVDEREKREERVNRIKISVPVLRTAGKWDGGSKEIARHVITGVHGGHGGYLAKPPLDKYDGRSIYIDHPIVIALLEKLRAAEQAVKRVEDMLKLFTLSTSDYERRELKLDTAEGIEAWAKQKTAEADAFATPESKESR